MEGSPTNFLALWELQVSTKSWYTFLCCFFIPEIFWNTTIPLRIFSVLWDKEVSRENRDIPFLSTNFFDKKNFWKMEGSAYEIFWYCKKINSRQHCDTPSHAIFFNPEFFWNTRVPLRIFPVLWENQFSTKSWYTILCNFFNPEYFWNTEIFSVLWDKKTSTENPDIFFPSIKIFDKEYFLKN